VTLAALIGSTRKTPVLVTAAAIVVACAPILIASGYNLFRIELPLIYIAAVCGMNLTLGLAGEFTLGQAGIMGITSYVTAIIATEHSWPWLLTLAVAVVAGVIAGVITSLPGLRIGGFYLGIVSFFVPLILGDLVLLWPGITGGSNGIAGVIPSFLSENGFFELTLVFAWLSVLLVWKIRRSGWGLRLLTLRDAPLVLPTSGVSVTWTKLAIYAIGSVPVALAGWMLAFANESVSTSSYGLQLTLLLFGGLLLGGSGTIVGPVLGVVLLEVYTLWVGPFSAYNALGLGVLIVVTMMAFPAGIAGVLVRARRRLSASSPQVATETTQESKAAAPLTDGEQGSTAAPSWDTADARIHDTMAVLNRHDVAREQTRRSTNGHLDVGSREILRVSEVTKSFGGVTALAKASLDVRRGRITALVGPNGSGKTTLVNVITGLIPSDSGSITVDGEDVTGRRSLAIARTGITRTFQVPRLVDELSAVENVEIGMLASCREPLRRVLFNPRGCARDCRDRHKRARELLDSLNMGWDSTLIEETPSSALPLGMKRIIEVARAMATGSPLLCLDEPASGLSPNEKIQLGRVLAEARNSGISMLLIEHDMRFVLKMADDIVLLEMGEVVITAYDQAESELPVRLSDYCKIVPGSLGTVLEVEVSEM
jgi:branched-chain amino acid transport system permease protein